MRFGTVGTDDLRHSHEKAPPPADLKAHVSGKQLDEENAEVVLGDTNKLVRGLHGRHMQMIAIGMLSKGLVADDLN